MSVSQRLNRKRPKIIFGLIIIGIIFVLYKVTSFIFGFGLSFPPNRCDLLFGHELSGDILFSKRHLCLRSLAIEKQSSFMCKNLSSGSSNCLNEVAMLRNDVTICREIPTNYYKERCIYTFASKVVKNDINQALEICKDNKYCRFEIIKNYQETNSIEGKTLVYRCLNYREGDVITQMLCSINIDYLVNWQGHHELFYMYGKNYPPNGNKLCGVVSTLSDSKQTIDFCFERVRGHSQEMSRVGSDFYKFLQENPYGLGEPK
jgi:hypothetical protein